MKLSELLTILKDCQSDPELLVEFDNRPFCYKIIGINFAATVKNGSLQNFMEEINKLKGPNQIVLVAHVPENRVK